MIQNTTIWKQNEIEYKITNIALKTMLYVLFELLEESDPPPVAYINYEQIASL